MEDFNLTAEFYSEENKKFLFNQICDHFKESKNEYFLKRLWEELDDLIMNWKEMDIITKRKNFSSVRNFNRINELFINEKISYIRENINYFMPPTNKDGDDAFHLNWLLKHDKFDSPYNGLNHLPYQNLYYTEDSYDRKIFKYGNSIEKGHRDRIHYRWHDRGDGLEEGYVRNKEYGCLTSGYDMEGLKNKKKLQDENKFQYY